ncbi:MAG TPA: helix-turn-helix domain-containing GNAT family N-acetyltransferase [Terriglobales bacterium]|nr:helix-turn-helix domain-containing GNAT family N-acetyltransferase [Terriglobales bacterium]
MSTAKPATSASPSSPPNPVAAVRHFNRFYTRQIGVLREGLLQTQFSLTEVRVLYEIANRQNPSASELARDLALDPGYLSRLLRGFIVRGLVEKSSDSRDRRQSRLYLTGKGAETFAALNARQDQEVAAMLEAIPPSELSRLLKNMRSIENILARDSEESRAPYLLRSHCPGDMGWVVQRHGALYWQEYDYDERFEALVAEIVAKFVQHFDPKREHCWIAERDGENVGCIFLVKKSKTVAKLRLLLVEPSARGLGIGRRLVSECVRFAHQAGYKKITLWTQSELHAARHLYEEAGFRLVKKTQHDSWSRSDLVAEVWDLKL